MTTTKATIPKHETHSYYVIILTFSPAILHCNSSFTLQWKLIFIFFASEFLWDFFFFNSDRKSQKLYSSSSVHSVPCNWFFFSSWSSLALLWVHQFFIRVLKMLIHSVQQYSQLPETCTCQSFFHEFLEDESLLQEHICKSIRVHPELSVNDKRLKNDHC